MKRRDVLKGLAALVAAGPAVAEAATKAPAPVASESGFAVAAALGQYDHLGGGERYITTSLSAPLFVYRDPGDEMRGSVFPLCGTVCGSDGVPIGNLEQQDIFSFRLRLTPDGWEDVSDG